MAAEDLTSWELDLVESAHAGKPYIGDYRQPLRAEVVADVLRNIAGTLKGRVLRLRAASIIGPLDLSHEQLSVALELHSCRTDTIILQGTHIPWLGLHNTKVNGSINLIHISVSGDIVIDDHCRVDCDEPVGAMQLRGCKIAGSIDIRSVEVSNKNGPAINLFRGAVSGSVFIDTEPTMAIDSDIGALIFSNCDIGGDLHLRSLRVSNSSGSSIRIDSANIQKNFWAYRVQATSQGSQATMELAGASIGGSIRLTECDVRSEQCPAISAPRVSVGGVVYIDDSRIQSNSKRFAVDLAGLHARAFSFLRTDLVNIPGPVLLAEGLVVESHFGMQFCTALGSSSRTVIDLAYSKFGGGLDFEGTKVRNLDDSGMGYAVDLRVSSTERVLLPATLACHSGDLSPSTWQPDGAIDLDHLEYSSLARGDAGLDCWLDWLRRSPDYAAHPYKHLANIYRDSGREASARRILVAQQDDLLSRRLPNERFGRLGKRILRASLGYGYQTWRAFTGFAAVFLLSVVVAIVAGGTEVAPGKYAATHTSRTAQPGSQCTIVERIGLGIDRSMPVVNTGTRERCDFDPTSITGQAFTVASWLLQLAAWALLTLLVVSYTGLVRRI